MSNPAPAAALPPDALDPLALQLEIGDEELVVQAPPRHDGVHEQRARLGAARIARQFFQHAPPTAAEIEQAIDFVEEQIMRMSPHPATAVTLWSTSPNLHAWAAVCGPTIPVDTVEQWFERLAVAAQGRPSALDGLPQGNVAAATLLVLREFMHHRGHPSITVMRPEGLGPTPTA